MPISLTTPLSSSQVADLRAGDEAVLNGVIYTARDAAHARLIELIEEDKEMPFEIAGQVIYYVGPTPAPPGKVIGSAGPTSSYRMDKYMYPLLERGLGGVIGKGRRSEKTKALFRQFGVLYFAAIGGAGALLSSRITSAQVIAYPDLGPEAIYKLEVTDFPVIVAYDCRGGDIYEDGRKKYRREGTV